MCGGPKTISRSSPCGSQVSNSGPQVWWQHALTSWTNALIPVFIFLLIIGGFKIFLLKESGQSRSGSWSQTFWICSRPGLTLSHLLGREWLKSGPRAHAVHGGHCASPHPHSSQHCLRRSQPAAPHRDSGALFPGTHREAQRPRGLARPRRDLHALQSQRFKVRSAGRPSPAWPRRYSSPRRREPLARPPQRVNGRAPPPSEALCVSARPAGPARDVPARPAAPLRQRPSPMLISLAARLGGRPAAGSPLRPLPGPLPQAPPAARSPPHP